MGDELTRDEAQRQLAELEAVMRLSRRAVAYGGAPYFLVLWGAIWAVGFGASYVLPHRWIGRIWLGLVALGALASVGIGSWLGRRVRSPVGARIGLFWLALTAYGVLWLYLARPAYHDPLFGLLIVTFVMFGYVVMGLWVGSGLAWLGLLVTVCALVGYAALRPYWELWMAVLGGGALFGAGVYIRRRWV